MIYKALMFLKVTQLEFKRVLFPQLIINVLQSAYFNRSRYSLD